MREDSYDSSADWAGLAETADRAGGLGGLLDEERHRRGIEGDDEDSSAFEDVEDGRGRARTRRVRGPELKKSMLEEALRSSLATLLSLAPVQAGLSQTPSMSYASLASLFQPTASSTSASSSSTAGFAPQATSYTGGHRPTPFASALSDPLEEDDEESPARQVLADVLDSSFSSAPSSGDATSFAPTRFTGTRAIPISRARDFSRSYSDSLPASSSDYSPLQPSQPLGVPTSDSPSVWSRRRTSAGTGVMRRRGRGRGGSTSPGPASVEERRRARAAAAAGSAGASASLAELKEGGESAESEEGAVTEGEGKMVERDEAFHDLLETARFFSDLSPRASRGTSYFSQPSSYDSANTTLPARPLATSAAWSSNPLFQSLSATTTPPLSSGEDDPALASESVPTLEGLSSEGDEHSPAPTGVPEQDEKGRPVKPEGAKGEGQRSRGFFPWLRKLGSTVEVKVWHLVGICGVLLGAGWAAGTLIRTLAPASWLASHLTFIHTNGSLLPAASSSSALSASTTLNGQVSPSHEKMSALFL
ncbi:hypothetical protein Rt10032_c05g2289 [Rhodotorula toruloides]|uniref:Uncharacterized protein n=1 Tax=Rhodotorula toruloides TaxID=5286 RepID=A0A511KD97_RHOTO|nr:hypothetical protein Rt10032_c05g2289 [Rhodotorula toruloides]